MESIRINPSELNGKVNAVPSKSLCHRAIIAAGLSDSTSIINNVTMSKDIIATCGIMRNFGVEIEENGNKLTIKGADPLKIKNNIMDCNESGSTLRFLIPLALLVDQEITFTGKGRLAERPLDPYFEIFNAQGIGYSIKHAYLPLTIKGNLKPDKFTLRGDISSQFISGLMFVLPLLKGNSGIKITSVLESKGYVDLTIDILNKFSISVENQDYQYFKIKGNQKYISNNYRVEGDFSQAAFWLAAGALGGDICCSDLNPVSLQGDRVIIDILREMGSKLSVSANSVSISTSDLKAIDIDASQCPDLVPILSVIAALSRGTTTIYNAKRLRLKESDRLKAVSTELTKLGADITETEDSLIIKGKQHLEGGEINTWGDHRIAMSMAIASIRCKNPVIINDFKVVEKSYPHFFNDFQLLGGKLNEWSMG